MPLVELLFAGRFPAMISQFSIVYLAIFLPLVILLYSVIRQRWRRGFLLLASYVFYWLISGQLISCLILSTILIHYFGLWLDRIQTEGKAAGREVSDKDEKKAVRKKYLRKQRGVIFFAVLLLFGTLFCLKYSAFFTTNVNRVLAALKSPVVLEIPEYMLPIGISFFTMQAMSYIFDVYHGVIKADTNIFRLALFMSFFPQIVEGPICRYGQTAGQLWNVSGIRFDNLKAGLQRILFGMMKKLVIADRLNPFIKEVFQNYANYDGGLIAAAAIFYTLQLYMDFSGTMDAVVGTAQIFGLKMPENFERPFFSRTISEFWKRWHISLGAWFKEYIFYPVTMSKPMKTLTSSARKKLGNHFGPLLASAVALFCVWFGNGLWHGSAWSYIFFGMYHFVLILSGSAVEPAVRWINKKLHIKSESFGYHLLQTLKTCMLVVIGELFFRAEGLRAGLSMFKKMITEFSLDSFGSRQIFSLGVDGYDFIIVGVTVLLIFAVSVLNEKGKSVRDIIERRHIAVRWAFWYAVIMYIVIFGAYGPGYIPVDPMYANF